MLDRIRHRDRGGRCTHVADEPEHVPLLCQLLHRADGTRGLVPVVEGDEAQPAPVDAARLVRRSKGDLQAGLHAAAQFLGRPAERRGHAEQQVALRQGPGPRGLHHRRDSDAFPRAADPDRRLARPVRAQEDEAGTAQGQRGDHAEEQRAPVVLGRRHHRRLRRHRHAPGGRAHRSRSGAGRGELAVRGHDFLLVQAGEDIFHVAVGFVLAPGFLEEHLGPRLVDGARGADRVLVDPEGAVAQPHGRANRIEAALAAQAGIDHVPVLDEEGALAPRAADHERNRLPALAIELHQVGERRLAQVSGQGHGSFSPGRAE